MKNAAPTVQEQAFEMSRCPIRWRDEDGEFVEFGHRLVALWQEVCHEFEADREARWVTYSRDSLEVISDEDAKQALANFKQWIPQAQRKYIHRVRPYSNIKMKVYPKHDPKTLSGKKLAMRTATTKISLFYPGISLSALLEGLWEGLSLVADADADRTGEKRYMTFWERAFGTAVFKTAFRNSNPLGAAYGEATPFILYHLDPSS